MKILATGLRRRKIPTLTLKVSREEYAFLTLLERLESHGDSSNNKGNRAFTV